jgi:hypothetical protein
VVTLVEARSEFTNRVAGRFSPSRLTRRRVFVFTAIASLVLAMVAAALQRTVFRYGSVDLDDLDYRNQAAALRHGEVTLPATTHSPFFLPYLTGIHDGRVVFTHQPLWAGFLACFEFAHLPVEVAVATSAFLCAVAAAALVYELVDDRTTALVASLFVIFSPVVLIQSGTLLGYLPTLTLGMGSTALMLRSLHSASRWAAFAGGFAAGLLVFNRPFDAVLFLLPVGLYCVARFRSAQLWPLALWMMAGSIGPLALMLGYNWVVMGSLLKFPYSVHPQDTIGFGKRASFGPSGFNFGLPQAWSGLKSNVHQLVRWTIGGPAGIALAVVGLAASRRNHKVWIVAGWVVLFPLGYFFFWTSWNVSEFGLIVPLGPFYYLGSLVGLAVLSGIGLVAVWRRIPNLAVFAVLVMIGLSVWVLTDSISSNLATRTALVNNQAIIGQASGVPRLVLNQPQFPGDPYVRQQNPPALGGPVLYGLLPSQVQLTTLARLFPSYKLFEVENVKVHNGLFLAARPTMTPLHLQIASHYSITLLFVVPSKERDRPITAFAGFVGTKRDVSVPATSVKGVYVSTWTVIPKSISMNGVSMSVPLNRPLQLAVGMSVGGSDRLGDGFYEYRYALQSSGTAVVLVQPGEPWKEYVFPGNKSGEDQENLSGILSSWVTTP